MRIAWDTEIPHIGVDTMRRNRRTLLLAAFLMFWFARSATSDSPALPESVVDLKNEAESRVAECFRLGLEHGTVVIERAERASELEEITTP